MKKKKEIIQRPARHGASVSVMSPQPNTIGDYLLSVGVCIGFRHELFPKLTEREHGEKDYLLFNVKTI